MKSTWQPFAFLLILRRATIRPPLPLAICVSLKRSYFLVVILSKLTKLITLHMIGFFTRRFRRQNIMEILDRELLRPTRTHGSSS
ncbi:hypothetical protein EDB19DRAFT_1727537 [Suillus lakei]|nr:hypothetical protein EDB19DRAFT_1727537 [Suillus lakei]